MTLGTWLPIHWIVLERKKSKGAMHGWRCLFGFRIHYLLFLRLELVFDLTYSSMHWKDIEFYLVWKSMNVLKTKLLRAWSQNYSPTSFIPNSAQNDQFGFRKKKIIILKIWKTSEMSNKEHEASWRNEDPLRNQNMYVDGGALINVKTCVYMDPWEGTPIIHTGWPAGATIRFLVMHTPIYM